MSRTKISVIAWDGSFREKFHTVDSFCTQDYPNIDFEFIWVDFYTNTNPKLLYKIDSYSNAHLINLNNATDKVWHLGKCINAGIKAAKGDLLVFPDGDIIVHDDHLKTIENQFKKNNDLVLYFRRWDELQQTHGNDSYDIKYLEQHAKLLNATNYAGCFALYKDAIQKINGYEESTVFAGPGSNGRETYLRLRNACFAIKWHEKKIYHPWHPSTGKSDKRTLELIELAKHFKWIYPYGGIKQSWVILKRELDLSFKANNGNIEKYLESVPTIKQLKNKIDNKPKTFKKFLKNIFK